MALELQEVVVGALLTTGILWGGVKLLRNVVDILFAACDEVNFLLVTLDFDVEDVGDDVRGLATSLLNQESHGHALIDQRESGGVGHRVQHAVDSLLLDEELVDIEGSAPRVSQTEAGHCVVLPDLPQAGVVINSLGRDAEQFSLRSQLNFWVRHNPSLLTSNLHEGQLLDDVVLCVVNINCGPGSIDSECSTYERSACHAIDIFAVPDAEN